MKLNDLCKALCSGLAMREVPIGYAIKTPFETQDGDSIALYLRRAPTTPHIVRFEDDGGTIADLEADGVSLDSETRSQALADLLKQYDAHYDEANSVIHTDYFDDTRAPANLAKFMALMLRIQDLRLLSRDRVRETFKEDVRKFVERYFQGRVKITEDENPNEVLRDYVADFVLQADNGNTLAVYATSTENKALEALLLYQELARQGIEDIRSMALLEQAKPQAIKARTMSRIMNSSVLLGSLDGVEADLAHKMGASLGLSDIGLPN
jgi:hypothetical protein